MKDYKINADYNNRVYIDTCRGVAIFLMLWGHCIQFTGNNNFYENIVFRTIYSFHMPLFMLISGYLFYGSFKRRDFKALIIHKTQTLLQPIIMSSVLCFFLVDCLKEIASTRNFRIIFLSGWDKWMYEFWFLWSVLAASVVLIIAYKNNLPVVIKMILMISGLFFVALFPNPDHNIYMYPYFAFGFLFAKYKDRIPKGLLHLKYISFVLFPIMLHFFERRHYIYTTGIFGGKNFLDFISISLFRWAIGFMGSISILSLIELMFNLPYIVIIKSKLISGFGYLGKKSLQYYILSTVFLSGYLNWFWSKLLSYPFFLDISQHSNLMSYIITPIIAVLYCFGIGILILLFEKSKISSVLFGR